MYSTGVKLMSMWSCKCWKGNGTTESDKEEFNGKAGSQNMRIKHFNVASTMTDANVSKISFFYISEKSLFHKINFSVYFDDLNRT